MYSSEDFERLFIRYKGEAYPRGRASRRSVTGTTSLQPVRGWYKEIRHKVVEVEFSRFLRSNGEGQGDSPAAEGRSGW